MARARNIKPGFFSNELLGAADPLLSILFAALWCLADKAGRLEDRPLRIKAFAFPYRDGIDCAALLDELARLGFITRYQVAGRALLQVVNFDAHQSPHHTEKASTLPVEAASLTVKPRKPHPPGTVAQRSDSLIPDSLIPDSLIPDLPHPPPSRPAIAAPAAPSPESKTGRTWAAYSAAYTARYGQAPVRNASVNGKLAGVVSRLGADEAPHVAAFYVQHNGAFYVRDGHSVGLLLRDCESLRTQWATGRSVTDTEARQLDRTASNAASFAALIEEQRRRESPHP